MSWRNSPYVMEHFSRLHHISRLCDGAHFCSCGCFWTGIKGYHADTGRKLIGRELWVTVVDKKFLWLKMQNCEHKALHFLLSHQPSSFFWLDLMISFFHCFVLSEKAQSTVEGATYHSGLRQVLWAHQNFCGSQNTSRRTISYFLLSVDG